MEPIDLSGLGTAIVHALVTGVQALVSPLPTEFDRWLLTSLQHILAGEGTVNVLTHVPTELTTSSGDVLDLWRTVLPFQLGIMAIVLAYQGYRVTQGKADIYDVFTQCGVRIALGQSVIFWMALIFTVFNAASDVVSQAPLDLRDETLPNDFSLSLMLIVATAMAVLAWIKGVVGVVFVKLLLVCAPVVFSLSALPTFEGLMQWWVKEATVWTLRPFFVALVLRLGLALGTTMGGDLQFLMMIVAFWLAWTMDSKIRQFSVGAWGGMAQVALFSRAARLAGSAFGGGASSAPTAAGGSAPAAAGGKP
jgi:hypothetical protein